MPAKTVSDKAINVPANKFVLPLNTMDGNVFNLYAVWEIKRAGKITINLWSNDGQEQYASKTVDIADIIEFDDEDIPISKYYTFKGWSYTLSEPAETVSDNAIDVPAKSFTLPLDAEDGDVFNLFAVWEKRYATIRYSIDKDIPWAVLSTKAEEQFELGTTLTKKHALEVLENNIEHDETECFKILTELPINIESDAAYYYIEYKKTLKESDDPEDDYNGVLTVNSTMTTEEISNIIEEHQIKKLIMNKAPIFESGTMSAANITASCLEILELNYQNVDGQYYSFDNENLKLYIGNDVETMEGEFSCKDLIVAAKNVDTSEAEFSMSNAVIEDGVEVCPCFNPLGGKAIQLETFEIKSGAIADSTYRDISTKSLTIGKNVTSIGADNFSFGHNNIRYFCYDASNCEIDDYFADGYNKLYSMEIGNNLTGNVPEIFCQFTSLVNLKINSGIVVSGMFSNCKNIVNLEIGLYVKSIGKKAFASRGQYNLLFNALDCDVDNDAFTGVKNLIITNNVKAGTFYDCPYLQSVLIYGGHIYEDAFIECSSLEAVYVGSGTEAIDSQAFRDCVYFIFYFDASNVDMESDFTNSISSVIVGENAGNLPEGFCNDMCLETIVLRGGNIGNAFSGTVCNEMYIYPNVKELYLIDEYLCSSIMVCYVGTEEDFVDNFTDIDTDAVIESGMLNFVAEEDITDFAAECPLYLPVKVIVRSGNLFMADSLAEYSCVVTVYLKNGETINIDDINEQLGLYSISTTTSESSNIGKTLSLELLKELNSFDLYGFTDSETNIYPPSAIYLVEEEY